MAALAHLAAAIGELIRRLDRVSDGTILAGLCAIGLGLILFVIWTARVWAVS